MSRSERRRVQLGADAHRGFPWRPVLLWGGLATAVVLLILKLFVVELVVVRGNTMAPNLLHGDVFTVLRYPDPGLGDVVLVEHEGRALVRRIVAVAGDRLASVEGQLMRNDALVETRAQGTFAYRGPAELGEDGEPIKGERRTRRQRLVVERPDALVRYATLGDYVATARPWAIEIPEALVPEGHVYVLCDNRRVCELGTFSGVVPVDWIEGVVGSVWWQGDARLDTSTPPKTPR